MIVKELIAKFGIDFETSKLNSGVAAIEGGLSAVRNFAAVLGSSAVLGALSQFAEGVADWADELVDSSAAFGETANELLAWRTTAAAAGIEGEQLQGVFQKISNAANRATEENKAMRDTFADLGVSLRGTNGEARSTSAILEDTVVALARIESPTERAARAQELLGRRGAQLVAMFQDGSAPIEEMRTQVQALFGEDINRAAEQADLLEASHAEWNLTLQSIKTTIGLELLPRLNEFARWATNAFRYVAELTRGTHVFQIALTTLSAIAVGAAIKMVLPFIGPIALVALLAAGIAALIIIVDDLITLFSGGKSVIGEFVAELFGIEDTTEVIQGLRDLWVDIKEAVADAWYWMQKVAGADVPELSPSEQRRQREDEERRAVVRARFAAQRNQDAVDGTVIPRGGETFAQALARTNTTRTSIGALPLRENGQVDTSRQGRVAAVRGLAGNQNIAVNQQNAVTVNVSGAGDPEAVGEEVDRRVRERRESELRRARDAVSRRSS